MIHKLSYSYEIIGLQATLICDKIAEDNLICESSERLATLGWLAILQLNALREILTRGLSCDRMVSPAPAPVTYTVEFPVKRQRNFKKEEHNLCIQVETLSTAVPEPICIKEV